MMFKKNPEEIETHRFTYFWLNTSKFNCDSGDIELKQFYEQSKD